MVATPVTDGFTQDVIVLFSSIDQGKLREKIREIPDHQRRVSTLRLTLMEVLSPIMIQVPSFVQVIVARAILEHVDWDAVIERILTVPEYN